jgi:hypothetical protein
MTATSETTAERIAHRGRLELRARLRSAFDEQAQHSATAPALDPDEVERLVDEAAGRADGALWRRSLAEAAIAELGVDLAAAVEHPEVLRAHELVGAPPYEPPAAEPEPPEAEAEPAREAVRIAAVHSGGIESLRAGEPDIELRFSDAGLDVLKRSTGAAIGRLDWTEIDSIELLPPRRGLRVGRRKTRTLHVETDRGRASFELQGLSEDQLAEYVQPLLERPRDDDGDDPPPPD